MKISLCKKFIYRIGQNEDIKTLCEKFNTSVENIVRNNQNIPMYEGELVEISINDYISHFVKPAETIEDISKNYNIEIEKIKQDNCLKENKLYIGQRIKIYK